MPISRNQHFDPNTIPNEPSDYIAAVERAVSGIRPSHGKELVWRNEDREKTGWSVVYLHGISASRRELAPMSEKIAELLDANLVLILLTDHGIDGGAMARATSLDWLNNSVEAITVGQRIGEKVLVTGVSTGPALATWAASQPTLVENVGSLFLFSANYGVHGASTGLLNMPLAKTLLPLIFGDERSFEPMNTQQAQGRTTRYPSKSVFAMASLLRLSDTIAVRKLNLPAFFIYSTDDKIVLAPQIRDAISDWGGSTAEVIINDSCDPNNHILTGDIISPEKRTLSIGLGGKD